MSVVALDRTVPEIDTDAVARSADAAGPVTWRPRPAVGSWWQTRQHRNELTERLLALFTVSGEGRTRDKTRRRGLTKLLDWLERLPGDTWQHRWLASGADGAGFDWTNLPLQGRGPVRHHHRDELCCGMLLLVCGQVIRPGYGWMLRQRQPLMLAEARTVLDADGFRRLEDEASDAADWARSDALGKITWMVIRKGGHGPRHHRRRLHRADRQHSRSTTSGAAPAGHCSTRC